MSLRSEGKVQLLIFLFRNPYFIGVNLLRIDIALAISSNVPPLMPIQIFNLLRRRGVGGERRVFLVLRSARLRLTNISFTVQGLLSENLIFK